MAPIFKSKHLGARGRQISVEFKISLAYIASSKLYSEILPQKIKLRINSQGVPGLRAKLIVFQNYLMEPIEHRDNVFRGLRQLQCTGSKEREVSSS